MNSSELDVFGKNELNRLALVEINNILPQLEKYIGSKINTLNGFSKKFNIEHLDLKPNPYNNGFAMLHRCYLTLSYHTLKLEFSICFNGGKYEDHSYYCRYFDKTYYLGESKDNMVLDSIYPIENIIKSETINLDEQKKLIERYKELEKELSDLKYKIKINF